MYIHIYIYIYTYTYKYIFNVYYQYSYIECIYNLLIGRLDPVVFDTRINTQNILDERSIQL